MAKRKFTVCAGSSVPDMTQLYPEGQRDVYEDEDPRLSKYTLRKAVELYKKDAEEDGDYYTRVSVWDGDEMILKCTKLDDVLNELSDTYLDRRLKNFHWYDTSIVFNLGGESIAYL